MSRVLGFGLRTLCLIFTRAALTELKEDMACFLLETTLFAPIIFCHTNAGKVPGGYWIWVHYEVPRLPQALL